MTDVPNFIELEQYVLKFLDISIKDASLQKYSSFLIKFILEKFISKLDLNHLFLLNRMSIDAIDACALETMLQYEDASVGDKIKTFIGDFVEVSLLLFYLNIY